MVGKCAVTDSPNGNRQLLYPNLI